MVCFYLKQHPSLNLSQAQVMPRASYSIWAYFCSVGLSDLETYTIGFHWWLSCFCIRTGPNPYEEASESVKSQQKVITDSSPPNVDAIQSHGKLKDKQIESKNESCHKPWDVYQVWKTLTCWWTAASSSWCNLSKVSQTWTFSSIVLN